MVENLMKWEKTVINYLVKKFFLNKNTQFDSLLLKTVIKEGALKLFVKKNSSQAVSRPSWIEVEWKLNVLLKIG